MDNTPPMNNTINNNSNTTNNNSNNTTKTSSNISYIGSSRPTLTLQFVDGDTMSCEEWNSDTDYSDSD